MTTEVNPRHSTRRFSNRVELYIKYRPHYPPQIIDFLRTELGFTSAAVVADIGSGTGILTRLWLEQGNPVFGVEPNEDMRAAAEAWLEDYPGFTSITGTAEATTLPDHCADFVTAGQSFHWFEPAGTRVEFGRILKPGGYVLLIWNVRRETSPFISAYNAAMERFSGEFREVRQENVLTDEVMTAFFGPGGYQRQDFDNYQHFDFEQLQGRALSSSYAPLPGHPNYEPLLETLRQMFEEFQVAGRVEFAYDTSIYYGQLAA